MAINRNGTRQLPERLTFPFLARASVACLLIARFATAQGTAPLGDRVFASQAIVPRWLGDVSACSGPLCAQTAFAEASLPLVRGLNVVVGGGAGRVLDSGSPWTSERRLDVRYATNAVSAWVGGVRADGRFSDTVSALRTRLESGLRVTTTNAEVALSLSAGRLVDHPMSVIAVPSHVVSSDSATGRVDMVPGDSTTSRSSEIVSLAELRGSWSVGRFLLSTVAGRGVLPHMASMYWGSVEAATPLRGGPLAFVNVGFAEAPATVGFIGVPRRSMSLGLRFSSSTFAKRVAARSGSDATTSAFTVQREATGQYRLRVRIPNARVVELASDCTGWKPVVLTRDGNTGWEIVLPVSAGSHLVNIRVDGGQWTAPPGLVAKNDDFAGVVGVFVVD